MNYRNKSLLAQARFSPHCMCCGGVNVGDVVAAHANSQTYGKAMSLKAHDWAICYACTGCHSYIDQGSGQRPEGRAELWLAGHRKTLEWLFSTGRLVIAEDFVVPDRAPVTRKVKKSRPLPTGRKITNGPPQWPEGRKIQSRPMGGKK